MPPGRPGAADLQQSGAAGLPVSGGMWWLDVEQTTDCGGWNAGVPAINLAVIQGAVDFLHSKGLSVGIYTDQGDWNAITGTNKTQFAGLPAWNANPYYTSPQQRPMGLRRPDEHAAGRPHRPAPVRELSAEPVSGAVGRARGPCPPPRAAGLLQPGAHGRLRAAAHGTGHRARACRA